MEAAVAKMLQAHRRRDESKDEEAEASHAQRLERLSAEAKKIRDLPCPLTRQFHRLTLELGTVSLPLHCTPPMSSSP